MQGSVSLLKSAVPGLLLALALAACNKPADKAQAPAPPKVLATVNGDEITQADLDFAVASLVGSRRIPLDAQARRRVLEGMVLNRVIAGATEKDMSADERALLDRSVEQFREQQLAKIYLARQQLVATVTEERIRSYYDEHLPQFGARQVRQFDLLTARASGDDLASALNALQAAKSENDWHAAADRARKKGLPVQFRNGSSQDGGLPTRLSQAIDATAANDPPQLIQAAGAAYLFRVTSATGVPAAPLSEVHGQIVSILSAQDLKQALDVASKTLLPQAKVSYTADAPGAPTETAASAAQAVMPAKPDAKPEAQQKTQ